MYAEKMIDDHSDIHTHITSLATVIEDNKHHCQPIYDALMDRMYLT